MKRLRLKARLDRPVIVAHRDLVRRRKFVYLLVSRKPRPYRHGRSRILYIGTTKRGASRLAASIAENAEEILELHGVTEVSAYVVECAGRRGDQSWLKLESALLAAFRHRYYELPFRNGQGPRRWEDREHGRLFNRKRVVELLSRFERSA